MTEDKEYLKNEIEALKPVYKQIRQYRQKYKVPKRARDVAIIHAMLKRDYGIKVPIKLININKGKNLKAYYVKGQFLDLLTCMLKKAHYCGRIEAKKETIGEK